MICPVDATARLEVETKLGQAQLAAAEALLAVKTARWYENVLFAVAGITLGLLVAELFLR